MLGWLESVVALNDETPPDAITIQLEFEWQSIAYLHSMHDIETLWWDVGMSRIIPTPNSSAIVAKAIARLHSWTRCLWTAARR